MAKIEKGTPLHRLSLVAGSGPIAQVFAGDVADACSLCANKSAFVEDLKAKSAVRPGERITLPTADIRKLIAAAQGQTIDGDVVSESGEAHDASAPVTPAEPVRDPKQPKTEPQVKATPEASPPGALKSQMMPKK